MFSQNQEAVKLEWMYKSAHSAVDREEYLLGRAVDKTLEQLNEEEKQQQSGVRQPKNHVEHECIPPSIRDYKEQVGEQVDLAAKLQEDPLVAIKKREEENRRQFLNNPIQIKKLQKALKAQKKMKKKKKSRRSDSGSDEELDRKLAKKLQLLKGSIASKSESKSKKDDNLDTILMHKYNQLKSKLSEDDIKNILQGRESGSSSVNSDDSEIEQKTSKLRMKRDSESKKLRKHDDTEKESYRKRNKSNDSYNERAHRLRTERSSISSERGNYKKTSYTVSSTRKRKNTSKSKSRTKSEKRNERSDIKDSEYYKKAKSKQKSRERTSSIDSGHGIKKAYKKTKQDHKQKEVKGVDSSSSSTEDSDSAVVSKKNWGLVKADGSKLPLSFKSKDETKPSMQHNIRVPETLTAIAHKRKALSREEKEKRLKEMMANASWRDKERSQNVKYYREKELEETESRKNYDHEFLHKQLVKSAGSGSVESRIKSNINNIQRSGTDMNRHFSRRQ